MGGTERRRRLELAARRGLVAPPPKRVVFPGAGDVDGPPAGFQNVPLDVQTPFRAYWDAFGSVLPQGVKRQRRARAAMLRLIR